MCREDGWKLSGAVARVLSWSRSIAHGNFGLSQGNFVARVSYRADVVKSSSRKSRWMGIIIGKWR